MPTPPGTRRTLRFESLEQILADAEALAAAGSIERTGNWTAGQNIDHVRRLMTASREGFGFKLAWPLRLLGRLLRNTALEKPLKPGFKIPGRGRDEFTPPADITLDEAMRGLREEVPLASQPGAMRHPSPLLGPLTHEQWIKLHCRHAEMHFSFLHPVDTRPAAPGAGREADTDRPAAQPTA